MRIRPAVCNHELYSLLTRPQHLLAVALMFICDVVIC